MTNASKDEKGLLAVRLGDGRLVPAEAQGQGPSKVVAAALRRLADLKRATRRTHPQRHTR